MHTCSIEYIKSNSFNKRLQSLLSINNNIYSIHIRHQQWEPNSRSTNVVPSIQCDWIKSIIYRIYLYPRVATTCPVTICSILFCSFAISPYALLCIKILWIKMLCTSILLELKWKQLCNWRFIIIVFVVVATTLTMYSYFFYDCYYYLLNALE